MRIYVVRDGDKAAIVVMMGAVHMSQHVGFCELCDCYRNARTWYTMRRHGMPYAVCDHHTPMDMALWEKDEAAT